MFRCEECQRRTSGYAPAWSVFVVEPAEDDAMPLVVTYCPDCALREFGSLLRWIAGTGSRGTV